ASHPGESVSHRCRAHPRRSDPIVAPAGGGMSDDGMREVRQTSGRVTKLLRRWMAGVALFVALLATRAAHAQGGFMGPGMGPGTGPGPSSTPTKKPTPNPNEPQTHAASGASDDSMRLGG